MFAGEAGSTTMVWLLIAIVVASGQIFLFPNMSKVLVSFNILFGLVWSTKINVSSIGLTNCTTFFLEFQ